MKNQSLLLVLLFSLIATFATAQSANKASDSLNSARKIVLQNAGEKNLNKQIKKEHLSRSPELLRIDSLNTVAGAKRTKGRAEKHKKEGK